MPLEIIRQDIAHMQADAIVNAANPRLEPGGGVCGAIFAAAGTNRLAAECRAIGHCAVGQAVLTGGHQLSAKYIIHTVGPIWQGGSQQEAQHLYACYINSLRLALEHGCTSIAFPLISSGIYGYPKDQALRVAVSAIGEFLLEHDMMVWLVVFDSMAHMLSEKLFRSIQSYIDDRYVDGHTEGRRRRWTEDLDGLPPMPTLAGVMPSMAVPLAMPRKLEDVVAQLDEGFSRSLLRLVDARGLKDTQVYKRANIDRKLFSKIRGNPQYQPSKATALALAVALELNLDETRDLLAKAGFALSRSSRSDLIVEYFIAEGNYNIHEINEALFAFGQNLLGA